MDIHIKEPSVILFDGPNNKKMIHNHWSMFFDSEEMLHGMRCVLKDVSQVLNNIILNKDAEVSEIDHLKDLYLVEPFYYGYWEYLKKEKERNIKDSRQAQQEALETLSTVSELVKNSWEERLKPVPIQKENPWYKGLWIFIKNIFGG